MKGSGATLYQKYGGEHKPVKLLDYYSKIFLWVKQCTIGTPMCLKRLIALIAITRFEFVCGIELPETVTLLVR